VGVVALAPRYDPRLVRVLYALDDRTVPIAELCRQLGDIAEALGLIRPSYVHVRRVAMAERARVDTVRLLAEELIERLVAASSVSSYRAAERSRGTRALRMIS
jgi:hypothetical protein